MSKTKELMRDAATRLCPTISLKLFSVRSRRMIEKQTAILGLDTVARHAARLSESKVAKGPFAGTELDYEALPVHSAPKFLGTYEQELHDSIERVIGLAPKYILNVGCAEGFYSVGLARRLPDATVFAADADPKALSATLRNAELNGVQDRVRVIGVIRPGEFHNYLRAEGSLLIMDCEGSEFTLLDPGADPILLRSNIVVEIHPEYGDATELAGRFVKTHHIFAITRTARTAEDLPVRNADPALVAAADERRGNQSWLVMERKTRKEGAA
jgi:hypothetical protein